MSEPDPAEEQPWEAAAPRPPLNKEAYQSGYSNALGQLPPSSPNTDYQKGYQDGAHYRKQVSTPNPTKSYQLKLPEAPQAPKTPVFKKRAEWTDETPMPFGKHKGLPLREVPVSYLHWMWNNGIKDDPNSSLADYIKRNLHALQQENEDLIWE